MTSPLKFPAARQPPVETDPNGNQAFTRPWFLFFQQLFERVGGANGASTADNEASALEDGGNSETQQMVFRLQQEVAEAPIPLQQLVQAFEDMSAELSAQRDQISELWKELDSMKQGTTL